MTVKTDGRPYFVSHGIIIIIIFSMFFLQATGDVPQNNNKNLDGKLTWAFLLATFPSTVGNPKEALNHTRNHHRANIKTTFFIDSNFSPTILHKPNYLK